MATSSHQQVVIAFALVLFVAVIVPRLLSGGSGGVRDTHRQARGTAGPERGRPLNPNSGNPKGNVFKNVHQAKMAMEQEIKNEKEKNKKGLAFTLMPLYAIGVAVFAAYKFVKIKSQDDKHSKKDKHARSVKETQATENQLSELEQRLVQTEKMLNSLLTQLDPLTNCVNTLANEQKNEIMTQLQSIKHLMKEGGIDTPEINQGRNLSCEKKLENLIQSLAEETQEKEGGNHEDQYNMPSDEYLEGDTDLNVQCDEKSEYGDEHDDNEIILSDATDAVKGSAEVVCTNNVLENQEQVGLRRRYKYD